MKELILEKFHFNANIAQRDSAKDVVKSFMKEVLIQVKDLINVRHVENVLYNQAN